MCQNHEGARHCRKPLGRSVRQSFNKQELSNFYYYKVGPIWLQYRFCICTNLVKFFLILYDIPKLVQILLKDFYSVRITKTQFFSVRINLFKIFLVLSCQNISSSVGMTKSRAFAAKSCQNCTNLLCHNNVS